jgi:hypothetical protein
VLDSATQRNARHAARHARTSSPKVIRRTSLSIRSAERRRWSADLARPDLTALVIHGMGGIGKSTLAAQIAARVSQPPVAAVSAVSGAISAASLAAESAQMGGAGLIVLDNFDDNLSDESGLCTVRDAALADLLAGWTGKLLITCGRPFTLRGLRRERIAFRHLGPLTRSGAAELVLSLPVLRLLTEAERDLAWRLTAGHPRAMQYLDALLATGTRFDDPAARITAAAEVKTCKPPSRTEPTELPEATAELIAAAVGSQMFGELFGRLSVGAQARSRPARHRSPRRSRSATRPRPGWSARSPSHHLVRGRERPSRPAPLPAYSCLGKPVTGG